MKEPMRARKLSRCSSVFVPHECDYKYDVRSLAEQIFESTHGGLPHDGDRPTSESLYDEDDVFDVDPSVDPSLDRFERTEAIASQISDRLKKSNDEKLKHAES